MATNEFHVFSYSVRKCCTRLLMNAIYHYSEDYWAHAAEAYRMKRRFQFYSGAEGP